MGVVWAQSSKLPNLKKFLVAFGLYSLGVQTVMYMATLYGEDVVGMDETIEKSCRNACLIVVYMKTACPQIQIAPYPDLKARSPFCRSTFIDV